MASPRSLPLLCFPSQPECTGGEPPEPHLLQKRLWRVHSRANIEEVDIVKDVIMWNIE